MSQKGVQDHIDLLIRLVKRNFDVGLKRLKKEVSNAIEIQGNYNRKAILNLLINAILESEKDVVEDAIYPVISKAKLEKIKSNLNDNKQSYRKASYGYIRSSYQKHYRRMLAPVIDLIDFKTNNSSYAPLVKALRVIKMHVGNKSTYYSDDSSVPIDGVITREAQHEVVVPTKYGERISRVDYEINVLNRLREALRIKEVWIDDAYNYRNPEEDVPHDFEERKLSYFDILGMPYAAKDFVAEIQSLLTGHLDKFNKAVAKNKYIEIINKPHGHIKVAKLKEQPLPANVEKIKQELLTKLPETSLLDVLKETDFIVNFLDEFVPSGPKEGLDKDTLKKRLLLAILGYGTNTGLKSVSAGNKGVTYSDLRHVKLRYLDPDNIRSAIRKIVNNLLQIRVDSIWEGATSCVASDSRHFKCSDQNLMSRWHPRYHKSGVMIYWHVDKKSLCIYSQLRSCASSEVASMIEGVLRHSTDAEITSNYVDTHGQSEVGFAFSHVLGFKLMPRLKNIHSQKLYYPNHESATHYNNLKHILAKPIKWEIIEQQYEQIIKYAVALKLGTANAESIMRRFTKNNRKHPAYKALTELGRALKTIFLCQYLSSKEMRQEIHEGLNTVENWNSANDMIFYGDKGTLKSKNPAEIEISMLCLHLLQVSMVYINTLMLDEILKDSNWLSKLTVADKRAINPLIYLHINPYGEFPVNMRKRIPLNHPVIKGVA